MEDRQPWGGQGGAGKDRQIRVEQGVQRKEESHREDKWEHGKTSGHWLNQRKREGRQSYAGQGKAR